MSFLTVNRTDSALIDNFFTAWSGRLGHDARVLPESIPDYVRLVAHAYASTDPKATELLTNLMHPTPAQDSHSPWRSKLEANLQKAWSERQGPASSLDVHLEMLYLAVLAATSCDVENPGPLLRLCQYRHLRLLGHTQKKAIAMLPTWDNDDLLKDIPPPKFDSSSVSAPAPTVSERSRKVLLEGLVAAERSRRCQHNNRVNAAAVLAGLFLAYEQQDRLIDGIDMAKISGISRYDNTRMTVNITVDSPGYTYVSYLQQRLVRQRFSDNLVSFETEAKLALGVGLVAKSRLHIPDALTADLDAELKVKYEEVRKLISDRQKRISAERVKQQNAAAVAAADALRVIRAKGGDA